MNPNLIFKHQQKRNRLLRTPATKLPCWTLNSRPRLNVTNSKSCYHNFLASYMTNLPNLEAFLSFCQLLFIWFFPLDLENKQTRETYQHRKSDFVPTQAYTLQCSRNEVTLKLKSKKKKKRSCRPLKILKFVECYLLTIL